MLGKGSFALCTTCLAFLFALPLAPLLGDSNAIQKGEMAGYLLVPNEPVPATYNAGFSMYVAAWPLLREYPGHRFQTGLFGTWMHAQYDDPKPNPEKLYSDIEGGLGWWRDTRFATETPKFIMGGVALNFSAWANGPGAGKGRDWDKPKGKYGVAQLSPWLLWPPDGLNLKQGTCGELFGYGYLPLPLTAVKSTTAGKNVPTGNHCWTLFLNTRNFKGPVAFFTPYFWSRATVDDPGLSGMFLDTRPSQPNRPLQMETQYVPSVQSVDAKGQTYARIAPTSFPRGPAGDSSGRGPVAVRRACVVKVSFSISLQVIRKRPAIGRMICSPYRGLGNQDRHIRSRSFMATEECQTSRKVSKLGVVIRGELMLNCVGTHVCHAGGELPGRVEWSGAEQVNR